MNSEAMAPFEKATILVVDDTPENIDVLRGVLKPHYKVKVAINGEQALKLCFSGQPPDLILLDVMMPGMDGFEVCRRLKAEPVTEGIPVIFVTAMNEVENELEGFEVGGVDYINKPVTPSIVLSRVKTHLQLRSAYRFIRETFGRYLSEEVVDTLIDSPQGLQLGGEKRQLTIMMADLRGFTSIGERLPPETVVEMINIFLGRMTEVIQKHQGTIDEFIGDAILAIFGAPVQREDDAMRAVRCAVEMQLAMEDVNRECVSRGFPAVQLGIGINTGQAIVGNIGSKKRSKYAVVGRVVNTASRIESYTIGGQILVSESTLEECGGRLRIDNSMQVMPKGLTDEITIYDVGGVLDDDAVELPARQSESLVVLDQPVEVRLMPLAGKHMSDPFGGVIRKLGVRDMEIEAEHSCPEFSNLRVTLLDAARHVLTSDIYIKVTQQISGAPPRFQAHATSLPPVAEALFSSFRRHRSSGEGGRVKLLHLTDMHIYAEPDRLIKGVCSNDSFKAVLKKAYEQHPEPDVVLLGGDLAQDELDVTYQRMIGMLSQWEVPYMVTPGNHANMEALNRVLIPGLKKLSACSGSLEFGNWQIIALTSHEAGSVGGRLAGSELERLEMLLAAYDDRHVLVALHHQPVPIGSRWLDDIGLSNMDELWTVIDRHPRVRLVLCGHIHQAFDRMRGDVRILGTPSTCVQFAPGREDFGMDAVSPGYRWLELLPDGGIQTGVERIEGFIPDDLNNNVPY